MTTHCQVSGTAGLPAATAHLVEAARGEGFEVEILRHRRTATALADARALGMIPEAMAKTVIARTEDGVHVRAVVPASCQLSIPKLRRALGVESVELLTEVDLVTSYPQFELGAIPAFGGPAGDRVVLHRGLLSHRHLTFNAGVHDIALRMRTDDVIALADAETANIVSS